MKLFNFNRHVPANRPRAGLSQEEVLARIDEGMASIVGRGRFLGERVGIGPNWVHTMIGRGDSGEHGRPGTFDDLGWAHNYRTDAGMDWIHHAMGGLAVPTTNSPATSITATSVTGTGTTLTSNALVGYRIVMPVTGLTTKPVVGNVTSNTTSIIYVDQWNNEDYTTGTTPAGTSAYIALPGMGPARFIGLTNDATAYSAGMTSLAAEITTNGLARALATFAHTLAAETYTLTKQWTATGAQTVHRAGNFTANYNTTSSGGGVMAAITDLNADATLATNDTLTVTWTWTLPNQGA